MEEYRTLEDVLEDGFRLVAKTDDYAIVTQLAEEDDPPPALLEQKSAGMGGETRYAEVALRDYNPDFHHETKSLYDTVDEMSTDAQVRNSLLLAKSPVLGARWFVKSASPDEEDQRRARFIQRNFDEFMSSSFFSIMMESLNMLDYGWYIFEKVFDQFEFEGEVLYGWRRMVPIHPMDVVEMLYDEDGGPAGIKLEDEAETEIEIQKLLIFTYAKKGGNMMGKSLLRSAYKHWFYKENLYKIDAIQKERHGVGVPIIKLPARNTARDRALAHAIGMNLRSNERAHVVLPPLWEIEFAKLEGQRVDSLASASHHGEMLYENVMGRGVMGHLAVTGNRNQDSGVEMFLKASRFIAEIVKDTWNKYAIPQICNWNWEPSENGYPALDVRRLGDTTDWRTMSFAMRNYAGSQMLTPDDKLEEWVREEMDLPLADPSTAREIGASAQVPGSTSSGARVGPSRQTPPSAGGPGDASTGRDVGGQ